MLTDCWRIFFYIARYFWRENILKFSSEKIRFRERTRESGGKLKLYVFSDPIWCSRQLLHNWFLFMYEHIDCCVISVITLQGTQRNNVRLISKNFVSVNWLHWKLFQHRRWMSPWIWTFDCFMLSLFCILQIHRSSFEVKIQWFQQKHVVRWNTTDTWYRNIFRWGLWGLNKNITRILWMMTNSQLYYRGKLFMEKDEIVSK